MKRIILILSLILLLIIPCWAGEKEELQLQKIAIQERMGRLMAEFELAKRDLMTIDSKLADLAQKEKKEVPKKEK
jgi:competence protein ComGC